MTLPSTRATQQTPRLHAAHYYDAAFHLKISPMLWLVMFYGLRHVTFFLAVIFVPNLPVFDYWRQLQGDRVLMASDLLVIAVLFLIGHRTVNAHAAWRTLWHAGRYVLMLVFGLDLLLFFWLHGTTLLRPQQEDSFLLAGLIVFLDVAAVAFLYRSVLVRDIFADFPESVPRKPVAGAMHAKDVVPTAAPDELQQAAALHEQSVAAMHAGQVEQALDLLRKAIDLAPQDVRYLQHAGEICRHLKRFAQAVDFCQQAARLAPDDAQVHISLAIVLSDAGRGAEAIEACRQALNINPQLVAALNNLGVLLCLQGDDAGGCQAFEQALVIEPENADAKANLSAITDFVDQNPPTTELKDGVQNAPQKSA